MIHRVPRPRSSLSYPSKRPRLGLGFNRSRVLALAPGAITIFALFATRHVDSILAITFDHDLQMTWDPRRSKALVKAHLFKGVSSQSEHFPKIAFLDETGQTEHPVPTPYKGGFPKCLHY